MAAHKTFRLETLLDGNTPRHRLHGLLHESKGYFNSVLAEHNHYASICGVRRNGRIYDRQVQISVECREEDIDGRTLARLLADWAIISPDELKQGIGILTDRNLRAENGDKPETRMFDFRVKKVRESYGHVVMECRVYDGFRLSEERVTEYCPVTGEWMYGL
ncbi:hypothetical protein HYV82_02340 [Candidatus Woesearchaeota archaeon]|nr:hypothetical protein [Candidatus Woesearchaeota archaeon]